MSHAQDLVLAAIQAHPGIRKAELDKMLEMDSSKKLKALCRDKRITREDIKSGRTYGCVYYAMPTQ